MMHSKSFQYKGQMINYYNKVSQNPKVKACYCGYFPTLGGYTVVWWYKDSRTTE